MRLFNILLFLFLITSFSIGVSLTDMDRILVDGTLNNASLIIDNITLNPDTSQDSSIPNLDGFINVLEKYIKFMGNLVLEIIRAGAYFGQDNPDYFNPDFIAKTVNLIIVLIIISLLIQPVGYVLVFLILIGGWIKDRYVKRNERAAKKDNKFVKKFIESKGRKKQ